MVYTSKDLRVATNKAVSKQKWNSFLFLALLPGIFSGVANGITKKVPQKYEIIGLILTMIISSMVELFSKRASLDIARGKNETFADYFSPLSENGLAKMFQVVLTSLIVVLNYLLLIVPGVIKSFDYALVSFLLIDENISGKEARKRSKELMDGHKMNLFGTWLRYFLLVFIAIFATIIVWIGVVVGTLVGTASADPLTVVGAGFGAGMLCILAIFIIEIVVTFILGIKYKVIVANLYRIIKGENLDSDNTENNAQVTDVKEETNQEFKTEQPVEKVETSEYASVPTPVMTEGPEIEIENTEKPVETIVQPVEANIEQPVENPVVEQETTPSVEDSIKSFQSNIDSIQKEFNVAPVQTVAVEPQKAEETATEAPVEDVTEEDKKDEEDGSIM